MVPGGFPLGGEFCAVVAILFLICSTLNNTFGRGDEKNVKHMMYQSIGFLIIAISTFLIRKSYTERQKNKHQSSTFMTSSIYYQGMMINTLLVIYGLLLLVKNESAVQSVKSITKMLAYFMN